MYADEMSRKIRAGDFEGAREIEAKGCHEICKMFLNVTKKIDYVDWPFMVAMMRNMADQYEKTLPEDGKLVVKMTALRNKVKVEVNFIKVDMEELRKQMGGDR